MSGPHEPAVWFPTVHTGTGTDIFTERLAAELRRRGIRAEITWLPLRAEYAPWMVSVPQPPDWATVAHVNTWLHLRFLPKFLPVVATIHHSVHDSALRSYKGFARAAYHRWWIAHIERCVLSRANRVIAVSHFVADTTRQTLLDVPMEVIYNGVDTQRFRPGNRTRKPDEPFRLLYVGGWKKLKGVDLLATIMRELDQGFELRYTGGPAADRDRAAMPANTHDIGRLTGDAVIAAMQDADALLFPSRSEGLPLSVLEAMACGLPIIATRGLSLVELVQDGLTGILCERNNTSEFIAAARRLAAGKLRGSFTLQTVRNSVADKFSLDLMVKGYMRAYGECIKT